MAKGRNPGIHVPSPGEAHPNVIAAIQQIIRHYGWQASPTFKGIGISGFNTAGFVKNTAAGVLSGGNTLAVSDIPTHDLITKHSASGLTTGYVVRASGATTFAWAQLQHSDLGNLHQDVTTSATPMFAGLILANGATLGQAAGPLLTFNDTLNKLSIDGCDVGIGVAAVSTNDKLHVNGPVWINCGSNTWGALLVLKADDLPGGTQWSLFSTTTAAGEGAGKLVFKNNANRLLIDASGGVTIPAMSSAGFVKNSVAGLLSGGNALIAADLPWSTTVTGLTYTSATGVLSLTSGYVIPTTTEETNWNSAYAASHAAVTLGTANGLSLAGQELSLPTTATPTFGQVTISASTAISLMNASSSVTSGIVQSDLKGSTWAVAYLQASNAGATVDSSVVLRKSRGDIAIPAAVSNGDTLGEFYAQGYQNAGWRSAAGFKWAVDAAPSGNFVPGRLTFHTSDATTAFVERMRLTSDGDLGLNTTAPAYLNEGLEFAAIANSGENSNIDIGNGTSNPADGIGVGAYNWLALGQAASHTRIAFVTGLTDGGTSSQRGGQIRFSVKPDASASFIHPMYIRSTGRIAIGLSVPLSQVDISQASSVGAIPVLKLNQADVSEEFVRYAGTSANATLTQSLVKASDVAAATLAGYKKIYVTDAAGRLTDQAYFVPFYTLA